MDYHVVDLKETIITLPGGYAGHVQIIDKISDKRVPSTVSLRANQFPKHFPDNDFVDFWVEGSLRGQAEARCPAMTMVIPLMSAGVVYREQDAPVIITLGGDQSLPVCLEPGLAREAYAQFSTFKGEKDLCYELHLRQHQVTPLVRPGGLETLAAGR